MVRDPSFDAQTQGADLARRRAVGFDPAAGMPVPAAGHDAVRRAGLGHGGLQGTHERPEQDPAIGQADDRVGDQLAGSVIGDLSAPLDADELDAARGELGLRGAHEAWVGLPAERQDRRMLQEQERVGDLVRRPGGDHGVLARPCGAVVDPAEPLDVELHARTIQRRRPAPFGAGS